MTKQTIADLTRGFGGYDYDMSRIIIHFSFGETKVFPWNDMCNACYVVKNYSALEMPASNSLSLHIWN